MLPGRLAAAVAIVSALFTSLACSGGPSRLPGASASSSAAHVTWTGTGPRPLSRLVSAGGRILYIGGATTSAELVALDPGSGAVAWSKPVGVTPSPPDVLVDGDRVFALAPGGSTIVALDGATGDQSWSTPLGAPATTNPIRCGSDLCVSVGTSDSDAAVAQISRDGTLRDTGRVVGIRVVAMDDDQVLSLIGQDLVLAERHATREVWRAPLASLFGGTPIDPAAQWQAWPGPDSAWIVWQAARGTPEGVATGIAQGVAQWDVFGARLCPFTDQATARAGHPEFPVLLCFGTPIRSVAAIDPVTGAGRWQLDNPQLDGAAAATVVRTSERSWLFRNATEDVEIDIVEGPRKPGVDVVWGWCGRPFPFPCTVSGAVIPDPDPVPTYAGATAAGVNVWVQDSTVRGYRP